MMNKRPSFSFPVRTRKIISKENKIISENLYNKLIDEIEQGGTLYIQGQRVCPICGGVVNYTYHRVQGFILYECSEKDCLPWPVGGAKQRREAGLPAIVPDRYQK
jgi:hypothetical protein